MLTVHHIPVCPFGQRVEIVVDLKGLRDQVRFEVIDITRPRSEAFLALTKGSTASPVMAFDDGRCLKESLVLMRFLDERFPERPVARRDPYERAVEGMLVALEGPFAEAGYRLVLNQDVNRRAALTDATLAQFAKLDAFLEEHNPDGVWLFDDFGFAEAVFTPIFMRFWFLDYYEGFALPASPDFARVRRWHDACLAHPMAQQTSREEVVKCYYDYARGQGNGALPDGRSVSSFSFAPSWRERPWPPQDKYGPGATDAALGLVG